MKPKGYSLFALAILMTLSAIFLAPQGATAQEPSTPDSQAVMSLERLLTANAPAPQATQMDPNAIMGFETLGTWGVVSNKLPPGFIVTTTTTRTQGSAAYSIANPPQLMTVFSQPVASTATALTGIGNSGALLQVDVFIPESTWGGIWAYISSPSHELYLVPLGYVPFSKYRAGIYNTFGFSIPASVSSALGNATFGDLRFAFLVASPAGVKGQYLFDNLRVHSVQLVQTPTGTPPPPGYGGSVNLVVPGNAPVTQTFNLGPIQIPNGFHLNQGTAGATTVQLQLGLDGTPSLTCTYGPDTTDATDESYIFTSCTGGHEPGDLVVANWLSLAIVGGNQGQSIKAQLALNPMGDLTGAGKLPPMPTFWGNSDTCTPTPVSGTVVTTSTSCSNQVAQASQIATNYFNQVQNANPSPNWIVAPVPDFATRHGDGTPTNNLGGPPPTPMDLPRHREIILKKNLSGSQDTQTAPLFDTGGDLNPGGSFDAYWRLNGDLTPTLVAGTDENNTSFSATFTAHGVLFGDDVDVVDAKLSVDTDSGCTTCIPATLPNSNGNAGLFVFGIEIPSGGYSFEPNAGYSINASYTPPDLNLPPIQIWIFSITLGAYAQAGVDVSVLASLGGLDLSVTPYATLGLHAYGAVSIYIASGGVDVRVDLIDVSVPVTAGASWSLNTSPSTCAATLNGSLNGNVTLDSGGGEVDLEATFGPCPLCYTDSWTLFSWGSLASASWNLFSDTISAQLFGLPASMCTIPGITAQISFPASGALLYSGSPITMQGSVITVPNLSTTYNWTYTPGTNASSVTVNSGAGTASPNVTFGAPTSGSTSTWTINLTVTVSGISAGGTPIKMTWNAAPVTISVAAPGSSGQSNWTGTASLNVSRYGLAAARDGDGNIYAIGGAHLEADGSWSLLSSVEKYNPSTNAWTMVAPMSVARYYLAAATDSQGNVYAIGGAGANGNMNVPVEKYNPSSNTWTTVPSGMLQEDTNLAAATDAQGNIYAIGGYYPDAVDGCAAYDSFLPYVWKYTPSNNTWAQTYSYLNTGREHLAAASDLQGNIYAIGGDRSDGGCVYYNLSTVEEYNQSANAWAFVAPMPTASDAAAATDSQGNIYAISATTVEMYIPSSNTWIQVPSMSTVRTSFAAASDAKGNIYAIGGAGEASCPGCGGGETPVSLGTVEVLTTQ